MEQGIRNADAIARKLRPASIKATNQRLEVARKERTKRVEIMEKQKTEAMTAKCRRARGGISLSNEEEKNYESDTRDKTDPNQVGNNKNPLQL